MPENCCTPAADEMMPLEHDTSGLTSDGLLGVRGQPWQSKSSLPSEYWSFPHTLHDWPSETLPASQPTRLRLKSVAVIGFAADGAVAARDTEKGTAMELLSAPPPPPPSAR